MSLRGSLRESHALAENTRRDADDILAHRARELASRDERLAALDAAHRAEKADAARRETALLEAESELASARSRLEDSESVLAQRSMLEEAVRRQDGVIRRQEEELSRLREQLVKMDARVMSVEEEATDLRLASQATTRLVYLFGGAPWLVRTERRRLRGPPPGDSGGATLTAVGRKLVLFGGMAASNGGSGKTLNADAADDCASIPGDTYLLDMGAMRWECVTAVACSGARVARGGHAAAAGAKNRLVVVGGRAAAAPSENRIDEGKACAPLTSFSPSYSIRVI